MMVLHPAPAPPPLAIFTRQSAIMPLLHHFRQIFNLQGIRHQREQNKNNFTPH